MVCYSLYIDFVGAIGTGLDAMAIGNVLAVNYHLPNALALLPP